MHPKKWLSDVVDLPPAMLHTSPEVDHCSEGLQKISNQVSEDSRASAALDCKFERHSGRTLSWEKFPCSPRSCEQEMKHLTSEEIKWWEMRYEEVNLTILQFLSRLYRVHDAALFRYNSVCCMLVLFPRDFLFLSCASWSRKYASLILT